MALEARYAEGHSVEDLDNLSVPIAWLAESSKADIMNNLLWLYQMLMSMLESPITLVAVAFSFGLGLWRRSWWIPAVVAIATVIVSALVLKGHWQRLGIDVKTQIWQGAILFAILTYSFFATARLLMSLIHKVEPKPRSIFEDEESNS